MEKFYTLKQVAEIIGIKYSTLCKDWRKRLLPYNVNYINVALDPKKSCTPRFPESGIQRFVQARRGIQN